jgi:hypothetical protein
MISMGLSHDSHDNDLNRREYGEGVPSGYVEIWPLGLVKISDIKNGKLQEPPEVAEDPGWVQYCIGLDVAAGGRDRTALCVAEITYDRNDEPRADIKYLKRLRKGIFFREISTQVKRVVDTLRKDAERRELKVDLTLLIDSTGVGEGLAQGIAESMPLEDCRKCYLTAGGYGHRTEESKIFVSKSHMVALLIGAIERGHIHFPKKLKELAAMKEEMAAYGEKISEATGNSSFGAMSTGQRDDEITAIGLTLIGADICKPCRLY